VCRQYSVRQQIQAVNADAWTVPSYQSGGMIPFFIGTLTFFNAFFRSRLCGQAKIRRRPLGSGIGSANSFAVSIQSAMAS
jgi:hypothetical protein